LIASHRRASDCTIGGASFSGLNRVKSIWPCSLYKLISNASQPSELDGLIHGKDILGKDILFSFGDLETFSQAEGRQEVTSAAGNKGGRLVSAPKKILHSSLQLMVFSAIYVLV
jgi:hypothetical protein